MSEAAQLQAVDSQEVEQIPSEQEISAPEIELRQWAPQDTNTLLDWVDADPQMLEQVGFETQTELVEFVNRCLNAGNCLVLAGEIEGELMGYLAAVGINQDGSANMHIGVSPEHRGRGKELMELGIKTAFDLGFQTLIAAVNRDRRGRVIERWDRQFGFQEPDAKILVLTKTRWESRNGKRGEL